MFKKLFYKKRETFEQYCKNHLKNVKLPEEVIYDFNVPYANDDKKEHRMDVFWQKGKENEKRPVIINIHGGGMILGNKEFNRHFCSLLCLQGFLVFSIEYSLVPENLVYAQFEDVALAMNGIKELIPQYYGDLEHVYAVGDSAGAYLALYTAAMQNSKKIAKATGVTPSDLKIKALGFISGMFYTSKLDEIGVFMKKYLYGKAYKKSAFAPYINPEHKELLTSLPPCFLITSEDDNLKHYTLNFEKALKKQQVSYELLYFPKGDAKLAHAFCVYDPLLEESTQIIKKLAQFLKQYE